MTDFPIVYDVEARRDLENRFDFILEQSGATRAVEFVDRIEVFVEKLGTFPEIGKVIIERPVRIRAIAFNREVNVVYVFDGARVLVLRLIAKGQDIDAWIADMLDTSQSK